MTVILVKNLNIAIALLHSKLYEPLYLDTPLRGCMQVAINLAIISYIIIGYSRNHLTLRPICSKKALETSRATTSHNNTENSISFYVFGYSPYIDCMA